MFLIFILLQRQLNSKYRPLPQRTINPYLPIMRIHHGLHITQAQSKPFHIMQIARMRTIELFKDPSLCFLGHANTIVFNPDNNVAADEN